MWVRFVKIEVVEEQGVGLELSLERAMLKSPHESGLVKSSRAMPLAGQWSPATANVECLGFMPSLRLSLTSSLLYAPTINRITHSWPPVHILHLFRDNEDVLASSALLLIRQCVLHVFVQAPWYIYALLLQQWEFISASL